MAKRARTYRFEMPYEVDAPVLTHPETGIDRIQLRDRPAGEAISLTLLDTADERLGRAGVLLAREMIGGNGRWLLRAPDWRPWLPTERYEAVSAGDELPPEALELLQPFVRRAGLGAVGAVSVERAVYLLLDPDGREQAQLLDDRVTVRRSGQAVVRQREVSFVPGEQMTGQQRDLVLEGLSQAGGKPVAAFGTPTQRLAGLLRPVQAAAAPPTPAELSPAGYLQWFLSSRLHRLWRADLQLRTGQVADSALLVDELRELADLVRGLGCLVDPGWSAELLWHVEHLVAQPASSTPGGLGETYFDVLDALALAARDPEVRSLPAAIPTADDPAPVTALGLLRDDAARRLVEAINTIDALTLSQPDADWQQAVEQIEQVVRVLNAAEPLLDKVKDRRRQIARLLVSLGAAVNQAPEPDGQTLAAMTPLAAYQAGRDYQRALDEVRQPRSRLLAAWPRTRAKVLGDWPEIIAEPDTAPQLTAGAEPQPALAAAASSRDRNA